MRAAVLERIGEPLEIRDLEIGEPRAGEVLLRIAASGICHSDYSAAHGVFPSPLPAVLGHEAAGVVEAVGPGVETPRIGDHVIAVLTPSCGRCPMCGEAKPQLCMETAKTMRDFVQLDGTTRLRSDGRDVYQMCAIGSFAERAIVPAGAAIPIPDRFPLEKVCLIGCGVTTGLGAALNTAQVRPETSACVVGCGGVGLSILQGARIAGATTLIAVEPNAEKRDLAVSLGATHCVDPSQEDPVRTVRRISGGGVHYAFEALGLQETIEQAWSMVRPTGDVIVVGVAQRGSAARIRADYFLQEKRITGSAYGSAAPHRDVPRFLELYEKGELQLDPLISGQIDLADVNDAFDAMGRGEGVRSIIVYP